jgi:hypothetical protein
MINKDLNYYGKSIASLIVIITFFVGLIIILDELINISIFCYKYTYLYNYGNLNTNVCKSDAIEYESARYKIYNEINKYKLTKDLFNKNWVNYIVYIIVFILSILISISFGCLFYFFFIRDNVTCNDDNEEDFSFLKIMMKCFCDSCHKFIPNCTINYLMLFTLLIIYPLIYIFKFILNIDMSWNSTFLFKIFHIGFFIMLIYYLFVLFAEEEIINQDDTNYISQKYPNMLIYMCFIITFIVSNYIFNDVSNKNNDITNLKDLYNNDDKSDSNFFDLYKQEEPIKPIAPVPPLNEQNENLLTTFKFCNEKSVCESDIYKNNLSKINNYRKDIKKYESELNTYNYKYNIVKNNEIQIPEKITVLYQMTPILLGFNKKNIILLYILAILIISCYLILNLFESKNSNYLYNTLFIYSFGILLISVLSNAILTYNTYLNKFLIYEPISNYKTDFNNLNNTFEMLIKKNNSAEVDSIINFYNNTCNKKLNPIISEEKLQSPTGVLLPVVGTLASQKTVNENINDILNNNISNIIIKTTNTENKNGEKIYLKLKIAKVVLSAILKYNAFNNKKNLLSVDNKSILIEHDKFNNLIYYPNDTITSIALYPTTSNIFLFEKNLSLLPGRILDNDIIFNNCRKLFIVIKNLFVENLNNVDKIIENLNNNIKYYIYNKSNIDVNLDNITNIDSFYNTFLMGKNISDIELNKLNYNQNTNPNKDTILYYKKNKYLINIILDTYKNLLLKFRELIIELLESAINCDRNENINIEMKLNEYLNVLTAKDKRTNIIVIKDKALEPKIDLYKKILNNYILKIDNLFKKHFNVMVYIFDIFLTDLTKDNTLTELESTIISNYNFFNDEVKHNSIEFINKDLNLKCNYYNKYNNITSKDLNKIKTNSDNVSYSFIILNIIFAIVLLEPTIINS